MDTSFSPYLDLLFFAAKMFLIRDHRYLQDIAKNRENSIDSNPMMHIYVHVCGQVFSLPEEHGDNLVAVYEFYNPSF